MKAPLLHLFSGALVLLFVGCSSGGGGGKKNPVPVPGPDPVPLERDIAGTWEISEDSTSRGCGDESKYYNLEVRQDGTAITVIDDEGRRFSGRLNGDRIDWQGSYDEDGGRTNTDVSLTLTDDDTLQGSATWTWKGRGESCSGRTQIVGYRIGG